MTSQTDSVELMINLIKSIPDWDGETTQYLLEQIGMDDQMLSQLMLSKDVELVNEIYSEIPNVNKVYGKIDDQINHRIAMILDDVLLIRKYATTWLEDDREQDLFTCLNNIEIACDLRTNESLTWGIYSENKPEPITMEDKLTSFYKEIDTNEEYFDYDGFVGTCHIRTNDNAISYNLTPFWEDAKGIPIDICRNDDVVTSFVIAWEYPETDTDLEAFKKFYRWYVNYLIFKE
jgi:hypothetical protein